MNTIEETTELVHSMEDTKASDYGTSDQHKSKSEVAETSATTSHGHSCSLNINSAERKLNEGSFGSVNSSEKKPCSCSMNDGVCYCGEKRTGLRLEPWASTKSIALFSTLLLLALWVVVISVLGAKNQL